MTTPAPTIEQKARAIADKIAERTKKFGFHVNGVFETSLLKQELEFHLVSFAAEQVAEAVAIERERCRKIAAAEFQEHTGFAGDYDAGATRTAKNIEHEIINPAPPATEGELK